MDPAYANTGTASARTLPFLVGGPVPGAALAPTMRQTSSNETGEIAMSQTQAAKNVIVVGIDFSEIGDQAMREAMRLTKQMPNSELHVTSVIKSDGNLRDKRALEHVAKELRSRLDELRAHTLRVCAPEHGANAFSQEIVFHARIGEPAAALIQVAVDVNADLIVVGTHRRHGVEKLLLGSVAEALIRSAPLPVLVAYPKELSGLEKTARPDPAHSGDNFHSEALSDRHQLEFLPRTSHISGLL
jgi:nucleotide-binding universal stress UspA family protein